LSVPMKKPRTNLGIKIQVGGSRARLFLVPKDRAEGVVRLLQDFEVEADEGAVPYREAVKDLIAKHSEAGLALRGARTKAGLTQVELAKKTDIPQTHLSAMETGKRTIGKKLARRLGQVLKIDYRVFL
jgi:DNA-binding XRE family transcriptional regulator